jgi:hypothetical protein
MSLDPFSSLTPFLLRGLYQTRPSNRSVRIVTFEERLKAKVVPLRSQNKWRWAAVGLWGIAGALYGVVLTGLGVGAAGAGHGTYLLLGIFAAPLDLLGFLAIILGAPLLWATVGVLAGLRKRIAVRSCLIGLLLLHYLSAVGTTAMGDWGYVRRMWISDPWLFIHALTIYFVGQFALIGSILRDAVYINERARSVQFSLRWLLGGITAISIFLGVAIPSGFFQYIYFAIWMYFECLKAS